MKYYIGIDLGTTNSAICSYDGTHTRIWKSPEQNDVTPSAIYVDRRGNRYYPDACASAVGRRGTDSLRAVHQRLSSGACLLPGHEYRNGHRAGGGYDGGGIRSEQHPCF